MDVIERYLEEVLVANETTNLTRIVSRESAEILHIEDSLSGLNYINEAPGGPYVDLGTGGGFPGVPLAVKTADCLYAINLIFLTRNETMRSLLKISWG